ncbi:MAG: chemotaxis response regulator protein-glutamate methylesterase [Acidobacteria bacterium]|nr:chemotaxis response regulator protein-glutamate methylesterase [Acidobacteriota bacterium]MDW7985503.1 chemotaxis response regulator protein-glutamate methylesterase [Acidobacteriota bacterium]
MRPSRIRVLVVDDSAYNRRTITRMLSSDPDMEVVDTAYDGQHAIKKVLEHDPDVITLDLEMPNMDGFTFLRWLMAQRPKPVIVISAYEADANVLRALEMGAFDFIAKPGGPISPRLPTIQEQLIAKVRIAAQGKLRPAAGSPPPKMPVRPVDRKPTPFRETPTTPSDVVVIGASTGGPQAIRHLLQRLPNDLPAALLVAQHMPPVFTAMFAQRLNQVVGLRVREAEDDEVVRPGLVYVAPGGHHMEIRMTRDELRIRLRRPDSREKYVPSVDRLFRSAAEACGAAVLGLVLTGMGDDGLQGAAAVKAAGGRIIVEHEETAAVYGMPRAVIEAGLADESLPLDRIPEAVQAWLQRRRK